MHRKVGNQAITAYLQRAAGSALPDRLAHALLSSAGNHAVAVQLQHKGKKPRDVGSLTDAELEAEIKRVGKQITEGPSGPRWHAAFDRSQALHEESERRYEKAEKHERAVESHAKARKLVTEADAATKDLKLLVEYANEKLAESQERITEYLGYYTGAYDSFSSVLSEAKADAARREAMLNFVASIVIGTGLGLAGGAIFAAANGARAVMAEAATELGEAVVGKLVNFSSAADFKPPPGLDPSIQAATDWQRLSDAWRGVATFNITLLWFGDYRVAVQGLAGDLGAWATGGTATRPSDDLAKEVGLLSTNAYVPRLNLRIRDAAAALGEFSSAVRHPLLRRLEYEIEQDLWIRWISGLRSGGKPMPYAMKLGPVMDARVQDALDEDAVEDHLHKIGVLGEGSRLGVDFGWNTTYGDTEEAYDAAVIAQRRIEQLGRIGVAVTRIVPGYRCVVHIGRYGTYHRDEKDVAYPSLPEGYFRAEPWIRESPAGQIVRVEGTSRAGLQVDPVSETETTGVMPEEEREGRKAI